MWVDHEPGDVEIHDSNTIILVFEMRIGMNEFDDTSIKGMIVSLRMDCFGYVLANGRLKANIVSTIKY